MSIMLAVSMACALAALDSSPYVFNRATLAAGALPSAVAAADLDGDGWLDLAVVNDSGDSVSVLRGLPGGGFTEHVDYPTGVEPRAIAAADLDGDGDADLAVVNQNCPLGSCGPGSVSILLNQGGATFAPAVDYATDTNPQSLVLGDWNGDQNVDLAIACAVTIITPGPGTVSILLGRGDGTFQAHTEYPGGDGPGGIAAQDFDGDARADLAVTNFIPLNVVSAVAVLLGNGDGSFRSPVSYPTANGPVSIACADLDADARLDLAVAALGGNVASILIGRGDGTFGPHADYASGFGPKAIAVGDLDRDGAPDLACSLFTGVSSSGAVALLRGRGDGTFQAPREHATGPVAADLLVADTNGDHRPDIVVPDVSEHVIVLLGRNDGTLPAPADFATGKAPAALARCDLDGDRVLDVVAADSGASKVSVLIGNGDGTFRAKVDYATGREPSAVAAADFDGDGHVDLAVANALDNNIAVLLGNGDGTLQAKVSYATGPDPRSVSVGDFDRDGKLDLVAGNLDADTISLLRGAGDGTFLARIDVATGPGPLAVGTADFDRDGNLDLANADQNAPPFGPGSVSVLLGQGDGTFAPHVEFDAGLAPSSLAIADLERDGAPDLAVGTNLDVFGSVAVLRGNGDGTFQPQVLYATGRLTVHVAAGDLDHDHTIDLIATNQGNNTFSVLRNRGDGTFTIAGHYATGVGPSAAIVGELNGDGVLDVAVANLGANTISVWTSAPTFIVRRVR